MMDRVDVLFRLQGRARGAKSPAELGFIMVNETRSLLPYRQAVLWDGDGSPAAVSGVAEPEPNAPFTLWLRALYRDLAPMEAGVVSGSECSDEVRESWAEWLPAQALWLPFNLETEGGLLFARDDAWSESEIRLMKGLAETYGDVERTFPARRTNSQGRPGRRYFKRLRWAAVLVFVFGVGFVQVPLTVLAPAEIVATNPEVVRAPLDGVVARLYVHPNDPVVPGQHLFDLDDAALRSKLDVAEKSLATARAEYEQTGQKALYDAREKARLAPLTGRMEERSAEVAYLRGLLTRIRVTAASAGVAVVDDPSTWIGRPVKIGERIMAVAEEKDTEIEAWLAVGDALELPIGAPVTLFLNADPLDPISGQVRYTAFRAQQRPDGTLAYRVRADISEASRRPRLGLKGTARIDAGRVSFAYWLLRRPLSVLRQSLGM